MQKKKTFGGNKSITCTLDMIMQKKTYPLLLNYNKDAKIVQKHETCIRSE